MKTADVAAAFLRVSTGPYIDSYQHDGLASSYQALRSCLTTTAGCCCVALVNVPTVPGWPLLYRGPRRMALKPTRGLHGHVYKLEWLYDKSSGSSRREGCVLPLTLESYIARLWLPYDRRWIWWIADPCLVMHAAIGGIGECHRIFSNSFSNCILIFAVIVMLRRRNEDIGS